MTNLQTILGEFPFESLPPAWVAADLASFSRGKMLWKHQQDALRNALTALWLYYDGEEDEAQRKGRFFKRYEDNEVALPAGLDVGKKRDHLKLLTPYYTLTPAPDGKKQIPYVELINRMGFWMATGSGKTLVIVKLLQLLWMLMQRGLIPQRDVLMLTHREDLLKQLRDHVNDYNTGGAAPHLRLRELREYPEAKREHPSLLGHQELTVFYYRSDNMSDVQKDRIIDFHNYENDGQWYVLLDEAHKGEKEDSKRQHIYNILSRNGFLFNFSATFTDDRDRLTTAYEYNLASFIKGNYGKHLCLLRQENRAFKDKEERTTGEKQRIVLQSLLMLTYVAKARERLCKSVGMGLYHRPLLLALVNSVNTAEADLKLFFRELARIGAGTGADDVSTQAFTAARSALRDELAAEPRFFYEGEAFKLDDALLSGLTMRDVLHYVFNSETKGAIEVLVRPSNDKELAFKLKSTSAPFALIKIGDITPWRKGELAGYEIVKGFEDDSFFDRLNEADSTVNLLMGSRGFYEGWDSNRPNVITFINIGGEDAQKFVLQAVGRGVRIEPLPGKRKRLMSLHTEGAVDDTTFGAARPFLRAVESLFIFSTNRVALETILEGLQREETQVPGVPLALELSPAAQAAPHPLLIPTFRDLEGKLLVDEQRTRPFELQERERKLLEAYVAYLVDDRLLLAHHGLMPQQIGLLHRALKMPDKYFYSAATRRFGRIDVLLEQLMVYFKVEPKELTGFAPLADEINHFKHISVTLEELKLAELLKKIDRVKHYVPPLPYEELARRLQAGEMTPLEFATTMNTRNSVSPDEVFSYGEKDLHIKHLAEHYYLPLLVSATKKIDYINHVIRHPSERDFVEQLDKYLVEGGELFKQYDWWLFSRTDETLDRVILPYYDGEQNRMRDFHPDFIFWFVKGKEYTILFLDPKGMEFTGYQHKIAGYETYFREAGRYLRFDYKDYKVRVALLMYHDGPKQSVEKYETYWCNSPKAMLEALRE